jgi:site-specific DNA-cytosine methylase
MKTLDAFCGAGGASVGLHYAGLEPIGIDFNDDACRTHALNGFMTVRADLREYAFARGQFELVWGSPPCQPWSAGGSHGGGLDPRDCIPAWLTMIDTIRPRLLAMENVKGLTFKKNMPYLEWVLGELERFGYRIRWRVLNAADYGVPQARPRLIVIGRNDGEALYFPDKTNSVLDDDLFAEPWIPMGDALGWGPEVPAPAVAPGKDTNGGNRWRRDVERKMVGFPRKSDGTGDDVDIGGDSYRARDLQGVDQPSRAVTSKARSWKVYTGLDWKPGGDRFDAQAIEADKPAPTVGTKAGGQWWSDRPATVVQGDPRIFTPGGHRANDGRNNDAMVTRADCVRVSNDELATLQSFPPGYNFYGTRTSVARQIGNAVPPPLAYAVVRALIDNY